MASSLCGPPLAARRSFRAGASALGTLFRQVAHGLYAREASERRLLRRQAGDPRAEQHVAGVAFESRSPAGFCRVLPTGTVECCYLADPRPKHMARHFAIAFCLRRERDLPYHQAAGVGAMLSCFQGTTASDPAVRELGYDANPTACSASVLRLPILQTAGHIHGSRAAKTAYQSNSVAAKDAIICQPAERSLDRTTPPTQRWQAIRVWVNLQASRRQRPHAARHWCTPARLQHPNSAATLA